jgi:type IV secretion system protein TrbF
MFRRPEIRYGTTPEPDTPYRRARQAWDDREGRLAVTSAAPGPWRWCKAG